MELLIRNCRAVCDQRIITGDIGISAGKISAVGNLSGCAASDVLDAEGAIVFPGLVDPHVHFHLPIGETFSSDDAESGSRAAVFGGVTCFIDFTNQKPGFSLSASLQPRVKEMSRTFCDYGLHAVVNDWMDDYPEQIETLLSQGVSSFKFFMCTKGTDERCDDAVLFRLLSVLGNRGLVILHAENGSLISQFSHEAAHSEHGAYGHILSRPAVVEEEAVDRACFWAEKTGGMIMILHLSSAEGLNVIRKSRRKGIQVMAETCPQYLILDQEQYRDESGHLQGTCPPVRTERDREALWDGILSGDIAVISSDHCPFWNRDREKWGRDFRRMLFGLPGVETILPLMYTYGVKAGRISEIRLAEICSRNASVIYGLGDCMGKILPGYDADLTVYDTEKSGNLRLGSLHMACDHNPYEGLNIAGHVKAVIRSGRVLVSDDSFMEITPQGKFRKRKQPVFI